MSSLSYSLSLRLVDFDVFGKMLLLLSSCRRSFRTGKNPLSDTHKHDKCTIDKMSTSDQMFFSCCCFKLMAFVKDFEWEWWREVAFLSALLIGVVVEWCVRGILRWGAMCRTFSHRWWSDLHDFLFSSFNHSPSGNVRMSLQYCTNNGEEN